MNWGVVWGIVGPALGAIGLLGSGWFASRATKAAAKLTSEAQKVAAEPDQRAADLAAFQTIRDDLNQRLERSERKIDSLDALVRAYSWTVGRLIHRMRLSDIGPEPEDIHDLVRDHMQTGV